MVSAVATTTLSDVRSALTWLDPNMPRREWAMIAMAIKSEFWDAFDVFDDWSRDGASYNARDCRSTWRSVKSSGGVGIGTLFKLAMDAGWQPERRELSTEERSRLERERAARLAERKAREAKERAVAEALQRRTALVAQEIWENGLRPHGAVDQFNSVIAELSAGGKPAALDFATTLSKYLVGKRAMAYGVGFPRRQMLVISDELTGKVSLVRDAEKIRQTLPRLKDKPDHISTRYLKTGLALVPLQNEQGTLVNLQFLWGSGKKSFFLGAQKQGAFHFIREDILFRQTQSPVPPICVGEGYATMAAVHEATGHPCVVAFDAGNLLPVCKAIRARYPSHNIIVAGDDDRATPGNPGRSMAIQAAEAVSGPNGTSAWAVFPTFADNNYEQEAVSG